MVGYTLNIIMSINKYIRNKWITIILQIFYLVQYIQYIMWLSYLAEI